MELVLYMLVVAGCRDEHKFHTASKPLSFIYVMGELHMVLIGEILPLFTWCCIIPPAVVIHPHSMDTHKHECQMWCLLASFLVRSMLGPLTAPAHYRKAVLRKPIYALSQTIWWASAPACSLVQVSWEPILWSKTWMVARIFRSSPHLCY